ncbi:hypothetical protein [Paenibacillus sp. HJGM_3]|uniref:hypothetical protein n=1 Tax=Paenibacillus sp. HJGM_3 TaxID=3379816 RepID=UPI003859BD31
MNSEFQFPNGEEKITIELTVKEALALSAGERFVPNSHVTVSAKRKLRKELEHLLIPESDKVHYSSLEL